MKFPLALALCAALVSCKSAANYIIPGAGEISIRNIRAEYIAIADEYERLEKYDKAVEYYKKALGDKKTQWQVYYKLGRALAMAKKWGEAESVFREILKRDEGSLNARLSLAYVLAMNGKGEESLALYKALAEEQGPNESVLVNAAALSIEGGDAESAQEFLDALKENFPESVSIDALSKKLSEGADAEGEGAAEEDAGAEGSGGKVQAEGESEAKTESGS